MKDDRIYLRHILECIRRIEGNSSGGRDAFFASHTLQDAVLRNLQTLCESAQRISAPLKDSHPNVEWRRITAFRKDQANPHSSARDQKSCAAKQ